MRIFILTMFIMLGIGLTACKNGEIEDDDFDYSPFPYYMEDYENLTYHFDDEALGRPFWKGNIIYNETVLLTKDGEIMSGKLLFPVVKLLSVRDYTLDVEYIENVDFKIEGNKIIGLKESLPHLTTNQLMGEDIPEPYRLVTSISNVLTDYMMMGPNVIYTESPFWYSNQLSVSYVYDVRELDLSQFPSYDVSKMPNTINKLTNGETVRITAIGDSVLEGLSSSGSFNRAPFMPNFMELTQQYLADHFNTEVILNNKSVGGTQSSFGSNSNTLYQISQTNPDLIFIHFGINDNGGGISPNMYRDNIELMILTLKQNLPDVEIILLNAIQPNPAAYDSMRFEQYFSRMERLEAAYDYVKIIDLYSLSEYFMETKTYHDMTGNGINHVNDYSARLYLMSILATIIEN